MYAFPKRDVLVMRMISHVIDTFRCSLKLLFLCEIYRLIRPDVFRDYLGPDPAINNYWHQQPKL